MHAQVWWQTAHARANHAEPAGGARQSWSTRGSSDTARSHTLRAWLMKRCRISISAYLSHTLALVYVTSSVRSQTLRARRKSFCPSSHIAYCAARA